MWWLTYGKHLQPLTAGPALRFGTLVHGALAAYYKPGVRRGPKPATTFTKLYEEELKEADKMGFRDEDGEWQEAGELGVAMLENYIDHFGKDEEWEVIVTEQPFRVRVPREVRIDEWPYSRVEDWFEFVGVIDGLWRHRPTRKLWIPDHKTTSGIGGTTTSPKTPPWLSMDDQAGSYWSFGVEGLIAQGLMKKNTNIVGMLFNFMRKTKPDDRPFEMMNGRKIHLNKDGSISKRQPSPYFLRQPIYRDEYDRAQAKARAEDDYLRIEMVKSGELLPTKAPGMFTCPMCAVKDVCELHETGNDWEEMLRQTMREWDPYAQHEIREGR